MRPGWVISPNPADITHFAPGGSIGTILYEKCVKSV
jgi:hypothetical protein